MARVPPERPRSHWKGKGARRYSRGNLGPALVLVHVGEVVGVRVHLQLPLGLVVSRHLVDLQGQPSRDSGDVWTSLWKVFRARRGGEGAHPKG